MSLSSRCECAAPVLKRREYLDLLAYILSLNDMPAGKEELPVAPDALKKIVIKWRTKP